MKLSSTIPEKLVFALLLVLIAFSTGTAATGYVRTYYQQVSPTLFDFYADNENFCPYQIVLRFKGFTNHYASITNHPYYSVIPANTSSKYLFTYTNRTGEAPEFNLETVIGDPYHVMESPDYPYILPYMEGKSYKVNQGYGTRFSHRGWLKYSIDFGLKMGTPVCAARNGIVVAVKDINSRGGARRKYRGFANYITVSHDDGTFAQYVHLRRSGSKVKVGDYVEAGQIIGYSGNTGRTTGPHLHFMIYKPVFGALETIPTRFLNDSGQLVELASKNYYVSYHMERSKGANTHTVISNMSYYSMPSSIVNTNTADAPLDNLGAP